MNFFQRRKILKKLNYMEATPIRKSNFETNEEGVVTLVVPKFKNQKFNEFMLSPRKRFFRITLDKLGSAVWSQIDGTSRVADICSRCLEICGDSIMPVEQRVTKFLSTLYEGRYISFREIEKSE
ncbi:MAG: PqqD family protein [Bacteroidales bacterium]|jgi:hypothetical protein|nr:PqqD family protein [Bacteroidales bacterium]